DLPMRALSGDPSAPAPSEQLTLLAPSEGTPVRAPDAEPAARRLKLVPEHVQLAAERVEGVKDIELADEEAELTAEQERAVARRRGGRGSRATSRSSTRGARGGCAGAPSSRRCASSCWARPRRRLSCWRPTGPSARARS